MSMYSNDKNIKSKIIFIYNMAFQKGGSFTIDKNSLTKIKNDFLLKKLTNK